MSIGFVVNIIRGGILQTLMISSPILLIGMLVGLVISVLQATTSIQEQTLTFVPKIAAILGVIFLFGPWIITSMVQFTKRLFEQIPNMTG